MESSTLSKCIDFSANPAAACNGHLFGGRSASSLLSVSCGRALESLSSYESVFPMRQDTCAASSLCCEAIPPCRRFVSQHADGSRQRDQPAPHHVIPSCGIVHGSDVYWVYADRLGADRRRACSTRARVHTARAGLLSRQIHTEIATYNIFVSVSEMCASRVACRLTTTLCSQSPVDISRTISSGMR